MNNETPKETVIRLIRSLNPKDIDDKVSKIWESLQGTPNGLNVLAVAQALNMLVYGMQDTPERDIFIHILSESLKVDTGKLAGPGHYDQRQEEK